MMAYLYPSTGNTINGNTAGSNKTNGIELVTTSNKNSVVNNTLGADYDGIFLGRNSNENSILGNSANGNSQDGVDLNSSGNNSILGNTANSNQSYGIALNNASGNNSVDNNTTSMNVNYGIILLASSNNNTLSGNNASSDTLIGIYLFNSTDNLITGNICSNNGTYDGIFLNSSSGNSLTGNTASSNNVARIEFNYSSDSNVITGNQTGSDTNYGISVMSSSNNNLANNDVTADGWDGIILASDSGNTLSGNTCASASVYEGIHLSGSNSNTLWSNATTSNPVAGVELNSSSGNSLLGNTSGSNGFGVHLLSSGNNQIYHNNFVNDTTQAKDESGSNNVFSLAMPTGGNYWSNWTGPDTDHDGIVDNPFVFNGGQDSYPWARQNGWVINYFWTWYDNVSMKNWVLMANRASSATGLEFSLSIAGRSQNPGNLGAGTGVVPPGRSLTPMLPGLMGGPVKVTATGDVIATQRSIFGPSFEEVPGLAASQTGGYSALAKDYNWTWYDQESPGMTNWVFVANPSASPVTATIKVGGKTMGAHSIAPGRNVTPVFPGTMGGPVEVSATDYVIASQRVLYNGYFNEVLGQ